MSDLPKAVKLKEVGPREGFQFEKGAISVEATNFDIARDGAKVLTFLKDQWNTCI